MMDKRKTILMYLQIGVCVALLSAPILLLLAGSSPAPYEGRKFSGFPEFSSLLVHKPDDRERAAEAALERMWFRKWSISLLNGISLNALGYVDTGGVVSGSGGYLFLKRSIDTFSCDAEVARPENLASLASSIALAPRAGVDLRIAIAPNKATVHGEQLAGRAQLYSECYDTQSVHQRRAYSDAAGAALIDHLSTILAMKERTGEAYRRGDTHWMPHVRLAVLQDLYYSLTGIDAGFHDLPVVALAPSPSGDLLRMLAISRSEAQLGPDKKALGRFAGSLEKVPGKTVILHDSFFRTMKRELRLLFEEVTFIHMDEVKDAVESGDSDSAVYEALGSADTIIVSVAERNVDRRLKSVGPVLESQMTRRSGGETGA